MGVGPFRKHDTSEFAAKFLLQEPLLGVSTQCQGGGRLSQQPLPCSKLRCILLIGRFAGLALLYRWLRLYAWSGGVCACPALRRLGRSSQQACATYPGRV